MIPRTTVPKTAKPLVSILIPCHNAERWVAEAIHSALDQTHEPKEVIVVDDGSTDRSLEIIKSFGDQIRWETGPNRGGNVARNRLLELSSGEWLQYLDADDYLLPNKIRNQMNHRDQSAEILWSPGLTEFWEGDRLVETRIEHVGNDNPWRALIRWKLPQTGRTLWKRFAVEAVGGWKDNQPCCQEHELYFRLLANGSHFQFLEFRDSVYRMWNTNSVCRRDPMQTVTERITIMNRAEEYCRTHDLWISELAEAMSSELIRCARAVYQHDPQRGGSIEARARLLVPRRSHLKLKWAPRLYRLAYRIGGFHFAEHLARSTRRLRGKSR